MNPQDLAVTFSGAQLGVFLVLAGALLVVLFKWALRQFQKGIDNGFKGVNDQLKDIKQDLTTRPTRIEMENHVNALHRRIDDHMGVPRRRATDETMPGVG